MPYLAVFSRIRSLRIACGVAWSAAVFAGCSLPSNGFGPDLGESPLDGGPSNPRPHSDGSAPQPFDATPGVDSADEQASDDASKQVDSTASSDDASDESDKPDAPADDGEAPDGCAACSTPVCCGGQCAVAHNNGFGQTFYDCTSASTYDATEARSACTAYAKGISGDPSFCAQTPCGDSVAWCYADPSESVPCAPCWYYSGSETSFVDDCACPGDRISTWN
jgi:hypothetical protein